jgi:hypothetical protein
MYLFVSDIQLLQNFEIETLRNNTREVFLDEERTGDFYVLNDLDFELVQFYYPKVNVHFADALPLDTVVYLLS